jgi:hypothetical protein
MVAREEVSIAIEQTAMPPSVSGGGYYEEFGANRDWIETMDYDLCPRLTVHLVLMDDSFTSKVSGKLCRIGNVIPMGQKDVAQPSQFLQSREQRLRKSGRVYEPVSVRVLHEIAVSAKRFGRIETAVVDIVLEQQWEI